MYVSAEMSRGSISMKHKLYSDCSYNIPHCLGGTVDTTGGGAS